MSKLLMALILLFATQAKAAVEDLIAGVKQSNLPEVVRLLENGEDVNATDQQGNTALHYAVAMDNAEITEALLAKGADLAVENAKGWSPLKIAERKQVTNVIPVLQRVMESKDQAETTVREAVAEVQEVADSKIELSEADMANYVEVMDRARDEITKVRQQRDTVTQENQNLASQIEILQAQNKELEKRLVEMAADRAEKTAKIKELNDKIAANKTNSVKSEAKSAAKDEPKPTDTKTENKTEAKKVPAATKTVVKAQVKKPVYKPQPSTLNSKIYVGDEEVVYCLNYLGQGENSNMLYAAGYYAAALKISEARYREIADISNDFFVNAEEKDLLKRNAECAKIITPKDAAKQNLIIRSLNQSQKM